MRWPRREHKERVHALCLLLSLIIVHAETRTRQEKRVVHTNQTSEEAACIASVRIARRSYCPTEAVLAAVESIVRGMEVSRGHPLTLVNIGANKGLNVNEFMMRFQFDWNTSNLDWWTYIGTISKLHPHDHRPACGMSAITTGRHVAADGEALGALAANLAHSRAYAIAVELIGATAVLLEGAFAHFGVPVRWCTRLVAKRMGWRVSRAVDQGTSCQWWQRAGRAGPSMCGRLVGKIASPLRYDSALPSVTHSCTGAYAYMHTALAWQPP